MHFFLKILSGMPNSVDPDQTATLSETLVFEILRHLPYPHYMFSWKNKKKKMQYFLVKMYVWSNKTYIYWDTVLPYLSYVFK